MQGEGGAVQCTPPPCCGFYPFQKKSTGNPYQKLLDFYQLFVVDATNLALPPLRGLLFLVGNITHALEG